MFFWPAELRRYDFVSVFEHLKHFLKYMYIIFKDISGLMIFYFIFFKFGANLRLWALKW